MEQTQQSNISRGGGGESQQAAAPRSDLSLMDRVRESVLGLDFENATREQVIESIDLLASLKAAVKQLDANHEEALRAWIKYHGDLVVGETRYYVGSVKHTRCHNNRAAIEALLTACGGDVDVLSSCIASDGLKQGTSRQVLGEEEFARHFSTIVVEDVKTGKPKRRVIAASTRFGKQLETQHAEE